MKKAKIMLMAITILAVVGGALAFKARTFAPSKVFSCVDGANGFTCSVDIVAIPGTSPYAFTGTFSDGVELQNKACVNNNIKDCTFQISTDPE
jgi:hypothetical protein